MSVPDHRMPILTYHSIDSTGSVISMPSHLFAAQMEQLAAMQIRGIALRDAVRHRAAQHQWPERAVVLSFDDGYANFFTAALPVLQRFGFSATVFVISRHIGGSNDWAPPPPGLGRQPMLSAAQVKESAVNGIEIGAHTRTHPNLVHAAPERIADEMDGSRQDLEDRISEPVRSFAYPYGKLSAATVHASRRIFSAACTTVLGRADATDLHQLPRLDMYYLSAPARLAQAVSGKLDWYLTVRRWARALRSFEGLGGSRN